MESHILDKLKFTSLTKMPYWYYDKEAFTKSPSVQDGLDFQKECKYRREGARFIIEIGTRMDLGYNTTATGVIYFHRFYMFHSFKTFPRFVTACCCLFLAGKVEETPKKCKDIIKIAKDILTEKRFKSFGDDPKDEVMTLEKILLQTIKFDLKVQHPYAYLIRYAKGLKGDKPKLQRMVQMAWIFINDSLPTTLCIQWEPEIIAIAVMYLAEKLSEFKIISWVGKKPDHKKWWDVYVEDLHMDVIEDICHQLLDLYAPVRKKKKVNSTASPSAGSYTPVLPECNCHLVQLPQLVTSPNSVPQQNNHGLTGTIHSIKQEKADTTSPPLDMLSLLSPRDPRRDSASAQNLHKIPCATDTCGSNALNDLSLGNLISSKSLKMSNHLMPPPNSSIPQFYICCNDKNCFDKKNDRIVVSHIPCSHAIIQNNIHVKIEGCETPEINRTMSNKGCSDVACNRGFRNLRDLHPTSNFDAKKNDSFSKQSEQISPLSNKSHNNLDNNQSQNSQQYGNRFSDNREFGKPNSMQPNGKRGFDDNGNQSSDSRGFNDIGFRNRGFNNHDDGQSNSRRGFGKYNDNQQGNRRGFGDNDDHQQSGDRGFGNRGFNNNRGFGDGESNNNRGFGNRGFGNRRFSNSNGSQSNGGEEFSENGDNQSNNNRGFGNRGFGDSESNSRGFGNRGFENRRCRDSNDNQSNEGRGFGNRGFRNRQYSNSSDNQPKDNGESSNDSQSSNNRGFGNRGFGNRGFGDANDNQPNDNRGFGNRGFRNRGFGDANDNQTNDNRGFGNRGFGNDNNNQWNNRRGSGNFNNRRGFGDSNDSQSRDNRGLGNRGFGDSNDNQSRGNRGFGNRGFGDSNNNQASGNRGFGNRGFGDSNDNQSNGSRGFGNRGFGNRGFSNNNDDNNRGFGRKRSFDNSDGNRPMKFRRFNDFNSDREPMHDQTANVANDEENWDEPTTTKTDVIKKDESTGNNPPLKVYNSEMEWDDKDSTNRTKTSQGLNDRTLAIDNFKVGYDEENWDDDDSNKKNDQNFDDTMNKPKDQGLHKLTLPVDNFKAGYTEENWDDDCKNDHVPKRNNTNRTTNVPFNGESPDSDDSKNNFKNGSPTDHSCIDMDIDTDDRNSDCTKDEENNSKSNSPIEQKKNLNENSKRFSEEIEKSYEIFEKSINAIYNAKNLDNKQIEEDHCYSIQNQDKVLNKEPLENSNIIEKSMSLPPIDYEDKENSENNSNNDTQENDGNITNVKLSDEKQEDNVKTKTLSNNDLIISETIETSTSELIIEHDLDCNYNLEYPVKEYDISENFTDVPDNKFAIEIQNSESDSCSDTIKGEKALENFMDVPSNDENSGEKKDEENLILNDQNFEVRDDLKSDPDVGTSKTNETLESSMIATSDNQNSGEKKNSDNHPNTDTLQNCDQDTKSKEDAENTSTVISLKSFEAFEMSINMGKPESEENEIVGD